MKKLNIPFLSEISSYDSIHKISKAMDKLDKVVIGHAPWPEYNYNPDVKFAMAHSSDDIFLKFYVCEQQVKAVFFQPNDPVYRDSCVEFFISFEESEHYYNLEFNSLGTCLMGYGPNRENRQLLPVDFIRQIGTMSYRNQCESTDNKNCWELMLTIPREVFCFHSLKDFHGIRAHANFYKCGDDLTVPHFLAWNNIHTPNPDFHQPNFFGMLAFA
jgi:hypothetical protein